MGFPLVTMNPHPVKQCSSAHNHHKLIMPLRHIYKAIHVLSPVLFIPSLYYAFLIRRIFIYLLGRPA